MKVTRGLPEGIEIYTDVMSEDDSEHIIRVIDASTETDCGCEWSQIPFSHSPDISSLRRNSGINISHHSFLNSECTCGVKEVEAMLGKIMMKCLNLYTEKYKIALTQDEGFTVVQREEDHVDAVVVDDNPFVNRTLSFNMPLNIENNVEYMNFDLFNLSVKIDTPSVVMFPSNFVFRYTKNKIDGLYEVLNYFNDNPTQEVFDQIFSEN